MHALLTLGLAAQLGTALPADSVDTLRDRARNAEARFERLSRRLAPLSWSTGFGQECDEIVGRFCLRFDSAGTRPEALGSEPARVVDARREAVEVVRRYFSAAPSERSAAGPLVRLLIRDGRASEAASAAGAFAALSGDSIWGELLQGLARHWAGAGLEAERHFIAALSRMDDEERRRWTDPEWLLHPTERGRVRRMSPRERSEYERQLWLLMDPFWMTPENERWNEHVGRHAEARLLADVPVVAGMVPWGRDLDELTVRYGTPTTRARQGRPGTMDDAGMVEYWDSAQRAYAPARLSEGIAYQPPPGARPLFYAASARSAYALQHVDRVVELSHQVTRFLRGDSVVLRIDAAMPVPLQESPTGPAGDSARQASGAPGARDAVGTPGVSGGRHVARAARAAVFVYDSAFTRRVAATGVARIAAGDDSARFALFVAAPPGRLIYSAEMLGYSGGAAMPGSAALPGDSGSIAGRARYAVDAHIPPSGPIASDLLISRPFRIGDTPDRMDDPRLRPFESLIFQQDDTLGIYAEVYRLAGTAAVDISVAFESAGSPSLLGRFARWIGRGLGLVEPSEDPRVGWRGEADEARYVVALNVQVPADRDGLHDLVVWVTDPVTGEVTEARRRILIRTRVQDRM